MILESAYLLFLNKIPHYRKLFVCENVCDIIFPIHMWSRQISGRKASCILWMVDSEKQIVDWPNGPREKTALVLEYWMLE